MLQKIRLLANLKQHFAPSHTYLMHAIINCDLAIKRRNQPAHALISFDNKCIRRRGNSLPPGIISHHLQFHVAFSTCNLFTHCFFHFISPFSHIWFSFFVVSLSVVFSNFSLALSPISYLLCLHLLPSPPFSLQLLLLR